MSRDAERCHALHEARGQTSKTAVAQRRVRLGSPERVEVDAQIAESGVEQVVDTEVAQNVGEQPTDQELERKVVDALASFLIAVAVACEPSVHDAIARGKCGRDE